MSHELSRIHFFSRRRPADGPRPLPTAARWRQSLVAAAVLMFGTLSGLALPLPAHADGSASSASRARNEASAARTPAKARPDRPGAKRQVGMASYYARKFAGRRMADGTPMRPESDNAASRTLPFGTKARVTNLQNGRTAVVTIRDRGPYVRGRVIDVSPRTARQLGLIKAGVARVEVLPLTAAWPGAAPARSLVAASAGERGDPGHEPL